MAEGTRLRDINEHLTNLEERVQRITQECNNLLEEKMQQYAGDCNKQIGLLAQRMDRMQIETDRGNEEGARRHQQLMEILSAQGRPSSPEYSFAFKTKEGQQSTHQGTSSSGVPRREIDKGKGILPSPLSGRGSPAEEPLPLAHRQPYHIPLPKLEFPVFSGEEVREWVDRCEHYFNIHQIPAHRWVDIATMHFTGKAHRWKQGYLVDKPEITWEELSEAMYKRYDSTGMKQLVREFNKLVQTHTVEKYQEKFEDLRARMLYLNPTLSEEHFVQSYISGLKEELIPFIDLSNPTTLDEVYEQAKLHEQALAVM